MNKSLILPALTALLVFGASCARLKKPESADRHEEWILSLNDSVAYYKSQADSATLQLENLRQKIGEMMPAFEHVSNPREVEGYYIYRGWASHFPLTKTEVVARISEAEGFELLAALQGGVFNQIQVSSQGMSVTSAVVPHDQALNYRAGNINTVCFTGAQADSIGAFIAGNESARIEVRFIGGSGNHSMTLPEDAKKMIASTWRLCDSQMETHRLEKLLPLLSRKVDLCRRMLHAKDSVE